MAHLQSSGTATELVVVDLMAVPARPNSRIAIVDIVAGSPELNMLITDPEGRRSWKVVGVGMTPPSTGSGMALTLEVVDGDGQILAGDRLKSSEDGIGNGTAGLVSTTSRAVPAEQDRE
jgi:hypothetical protein